MKTMNVSLFVHFHYLRTQLCLWWRCTAQAYKLVVILGPLLWNMRHSERCFICIKYWLRALVPIGLTLKNSTVCPHSVLLRLLWIRTDIIFLPTIGWLVFFKHVHKIPKSDYYLRHVCPSVRPSVCPHRTTRLPPDRFSWNFIFKDFFENLPRKFKFN